MDMMNKLEARIGEWYKGAPHLSKKSQDWLATNVWWLTLIWVVLGVMGLLALLPLIALANGLWFMAGVSGAVGGYYGPGLLFFPVVLLVSVVIGVSAIAPLKAGRRKGWSLLFLAVMLDVLSRVVQFLFDYQIFSLIWNLLGIAVGLYFLYEIRNHFVTGKATKDVKKAA